MSIMLTNDPVEAPGTREDLSDAEVFELQAARVSTPRAGVTDSFRLHAPLELLARHALLQYVEPRRRSAVRSQMAAIGDLFQESGDPIPSPAALQLVPDLHRSIAERDSAGADLWMIAVAPTLTVDNLVGALADEVLLRLAGAAHGSILLHLLLRVAPRSPAATQLGRRIVAELAADPAQRIEWISRRSEPSPGPQASGDRLAAALVDPDSPGDTGISSIAPTMSLVDRSGLAADVLDGPTSGLSVRDARRVLLRTAAHSMLQDDPTRAPYGWTHCLTMPQATLAIARFCARPEQAVAVASTFVLGFRSTLSKTPIDRGWQPPRPRGTPTSDATELLEHGPHHAAATLWHASPDHRPSLIRQLAGVAATHHDAHLAKYTLACLDAAREDPEAAHLFLSAAAYLTAWWHDLEAAP